MNVGSSITTALKAMVANKVRSALTMLGIVIGIASVISLLTVGQGAQQQILSQVQGWGPNTITIFPLSNIGESFQSTSAIENFLNAKLDRRIIDRLENEVAFPEINGISPEVRGTFEVSRGSRTQSQSVYGINEQYFDIREIEITSGIPFGAEDNNRLAQVALLGPDPKAEFFGESDPIGEVIRIDGSSYRVIGTFEQDGDPEFNERIYLPVRTATELLIGDRDYNQIVVSVSSEDLVDPTAIKIEDMLRDFYNLSETDDPNFSVTTAGDILSLVSTITGVFTSFLAAIASISLLVGGIGIMNIMLVSVTERTREIGLRKAVGAKESDIRNQFIIESLVLTLTGGIIGILLGLLFALLISELGNIPFVLSIEAIMLATSVATLIGLLFGLYPAFRAARLDPIAALRYE